MELVDSYEQVPMPRTDEAATKSVLRRRRCLDLRKLVRDQAQWSLRAMLMADR